MKGINMEETILYRLKTEMSKLTPSQQKVASYILKNSMEVPFMTMEQVAFKVEVSAATIMRLAYHFGYSGYSELQKELQGNIRRKLEPSKQFARDISKVEGNNLIQGYGDQQIANIQRTIGQLSADDLRSGAELILGAKKVYLLGIRSSSAIANYLEDRMARLGIDCEHLQGDTGRNQAILGRIDESVVMISVSFPRYAVTTVSMTQFAKTKNAKIIGITDSSSSPVGELAEVSLNCAFDSMVFHNSLLSAFFIADLLLLEIARQQPERIQDHLEQIEKVIKDVKANVY